MSKQPAFCRPLLMPRLFPIFAAMLLAATLLGSCTTGQVTNYVREGADLTFVKKIAIMPFENNSKEKFAPGRVRNVVVTQILVDKLFDVTEVGQLEKVLEEEANKNATSLDETTARRIGKRLSVQAFLLGAVDEYDVERKSSYSYPKMAMTLRLMDAETGIILWQASGSDSGYSSVNRILGNEGSNETEVTFALVRKLLASLK